MVAGQGEGNGGHVGQTVVSGLERHGLDRRFLTDVGSAPMRNRVYFAFGFYWYAYRDAGRGRGRLRD